MRVFISVELNDEAKEEIARIQEKLPEFYGKKTKLENLHLTLKFLGEIDESKVERVREKLKEIKFDKFEVGLGGVGVFSEESIRIIWIKLDGCEELQKIIDEKLYGLFNRENRFMSHITIARIKKIEDREKFLEKIKKIGVERIKFIVDKFYLRESKLNKKGAEYEVIGEYGLGGN